MSNNYTTYYDVEVALYQGTVKDLNTMSVNHVINISKDDIISIAIIHNFDGALYPIIRVRLYADISVMEKLAEYPDDIYATIGFAGSVYNTASEDSTPKMIAGVGGATSFCGKVYLENKNVPVSTADDYDQGLKRSSDLNVNRKVPITLFCYDHDMVRFMIQKVNSIYKDMDITSVIETIFRKQGSVDINMDPIANQEKYKQILFPNLTVSQALTFLEAKYGLYPKGAIIYGDEEGNINISNSDVNVMTKYPIAIHVQSYKDSSDMGGLRYNLGAYHFNVKSDNVSVTTVSDIERVLNAENINAVNVDTLDITTTKMTKLFDEADREIAFRSRQQYGESYASLLKQKIQTPDILHKSKNKYITDLYNARINERITRIDISGTGFVVSGMDVNARYNIIFDSPIRGMDVNQFYRASRVIHTFSNIGGGLFGVQTTMTLCSN